MEYTFMKTADIIEDDSRNNENNRKCPLDIGTIPNYMGINLCSVDGVGWQRQSDNQLTSVTIYFKPIDNKE